MDGLEGFLILIEVKFTTLIILSAQLISFYYIHNVLPPSPLSTNSRTFSSHKKVEGYFEICCYIVWL